MNSGFFNIHRHGFVRVAVATPAVALADPMVNAQAVITMARDAEARGASLVLFPELGISAYSIDDLLQQSALQQAVHAALATIAEASRDLACVLFVGAPLAAGGRLYKRQWPFKAVVFLRPIPRPICPTIGSFMRNGILRPAAALFRRRFASRLMPFPSVRMS